MQKQKSGSILNTRYHEEDLLQPLNAVLVPGRADVHADGLAAHQVLRQQHDEALRRQRRRTRVSLERHWTGRRGALPTWKMTRKRFFCSLWADSTFSCSLSICSSSWPSSSSLALSMSSSSPLSLCQHTRVSYRISVNVTVDAFAPFSNRYIVNFWTI